MKITLEWLKEKGACDDGIAWFEAQKKTESPAVLKALIADEKFDYANWLIVRVMTRHQYLGYAIFAAEQVIDIYEKKYPNEDRPRKAIEAAKVVLANDTPKTRDAAWAAAGDAAGAARAAAWAAAWAAWAAARAAAWAAWAAAGDAAWAARAAAWAAWAAAGDAAWAARQMKLRILEYGIGLLESESDK